MLYKTAWVLVWLLSRVAFRYKVIGGKNIPLEGPVVVCANHGHSFDPLFVATSFKRRLKFMAKKELFENNKLFAKIIAKLGAFPVDRSVSDLAAYKKALAILVDNGALLIFSQGTRIKNEIDVKNAKYGAALFALKSGAPLLPVGIDANYRFFSRVRVRVGQPIYLDEYKDEKIKTELLDKITQNLMNQIKKLAGGDKN